MPANKGGQPRKIKSPDDMLKAWEDYKKKCDSHTTVNTEFSAKESRFVTQKVNRPLTYTLDGFYIDLGITKQTFHLTYADDEKYSDVVSHIREECRFNQRQRFEDGTLDTRLAGLWLGKYVDDYKMPAQQQDKGEIQEVLNEVKQSLSKLFGE